MDDLTPTDAERRAAAFCKHLTVLRVGEHRAVQCNDCHRIIPRAAAILYRFDSTYHCEDGRDCAAALASMAKGEVG